VLTASDRPGGESVAAFDGDERSLSGNDGEPGHDEALKESTAATTTTREARFSSIIVLRVPFKLMLSMLIDRADRDELIVVSTPAG
jgi:hypothetical protein